MKQGTFSVGDSGSDSSFEIRQSAKSILLKVVFNGPEYETREDAVAALYAAMNGNISISYKQNKPSYSSSMVPDLKFSDVVEAFACTGQPIDIFTVEDGEGFTYTAYIKLPISLVGNIPLGSDAYIKLEFDGFTNEAVAGLDDVNFDAVCSISTEVDSVDANSLVYLESVNIPNGNQTDFSVMGYSLLIVPASMRRLNMYTSTGASLEVSDDDLDEYVRLNTLPHFFVEGVRLHHKDHIVFNALRYSKASLSLNSGSQALLLVSRLLFA